MRTYVFFMLALTGLSIFAANDELSFKPQPPLTDLDKNSSYFVKGVAYFEEGKYTEAYNTLTKVVELPYLDSYVKYYKGLAALNAFNSEVELKKGLESLYYAEMNSSVLSDPIKDKIPAFELKLAKVMAENKHCKNSLYHYSIARTKGLTDKLDDEFSLVKSYVNFATKKLQLRFC